MPLALGCLSPMSTRIPYAIANYEKIVAGNYHFVDKDEFSLGFPNLSVKILFLEYYNELKKISVSSGYTEMCRALCAVALFIRSARRVFVIFELKP